MRVFRQAFVGFLLALASGAFGFGCDERAATLPQTLTIDALGQVGLRCELDAARSSVDELHWWCERDVVADGTAGGEVSFEGSGGTHWSCVELAGFEGSGGTHWFCEETGASNVAPGSQGGWDCVETNTENPQSDWTCVPSSRPSEEPACTALSHPPQGLWTDPFEWVSDCSASRDSVYSPGETSPTPSMRESMRWSRSRCMAWVARLRRFSAPGSTTSQIWPKTSSKSASSKEASPSRPARR